jgi:CDP-diacylglycerol--glycerol-3-phosphate 3-phosphatidyltransferase
MRRRFKAGVRRIARPLGAALSRAGVSADALTLFGVVCAFPAAYGFFAGRALLAFPFLLLSGVSDLLDGAVARAGGRPGTRFGAALDSTLDRYGEGLVLAGILLGLADRGAAPWLLVLAALAGIGSYLVSYVRARAEGLGVECEVGFLERPERLVLLLILALWGDGGAPWILGLIALLSHVTFLHRLLHVRRETSARVAETSGGAGR